MSSVGFEPAIPASKRLQTHAFARTATGIGIFDRNFFPSILTEFLPESSNLLNIPQNRITTVSFHMRSNSFSSNAVNRRRVATAIECLQENKQINKLGAIK